MANLINQTIKTQQKQFYTTLLPITMQLDQYSSDRFQQYICYNHHYPWGMFEASLDI